MSKLNAALDYDTFNGMNVRLEWEAGGIPQLFLRNDRADGDGFGVLIEPEELVWLAQLFINFAMDVQGAIDFIKSKNDG